jgi:hypothetical protein
MPTVFGEHKSQELADGLDQLQEKIAGKPAPRKSPQKTTAVSPFHEPALEKRLKLLLWGDTGTGKTVLSLAFPSPCVIDLERGTEAYAGKFKFDSLPTTSSDEATAAVRYLLENKHHYKTLIVDPITVFWESLQTKWNAIFLNRNKDKKGYRFEYYDIQPRDWMSIKAEIKEFVRMLTALDMSVIVTAREKSQYAEGTLMQKIGATFDAERSLPYIFDVVVRLYRDGPKYMAQVIKDRYQALPKDPFPASYDVFAKAFGQEHLERAAKPFQVATPVQVKKIYELAAEYGLDDPTVLARVRTYGANTVESLSQENASVIIGKLETALLVKGRNTKE